MKSGLYYCIKNKDSNIKRQPFLYLSYIIESLLTIPNFGV